MSEIIKINDNVNVEIKKIKDRTIIILDRMGERVILSDLKTSDTFTCHVVRDDNYVVVYSKGCMKNQIPLVVECAYNIKTDTILNIKEFDYEKAVEELGGEYLSFHKMPQIVDTEEDKVQVFKVLATRKRKPYIISEEELQPTDVSNKNEVKEMAQEFKRNNLVRARRRDIPRTN